MSGAVLAACAQMMKRRRERREAEAEAEAQAQVPAPAPAPAPAPVPAPARAPANHAPALASAPANCASANHTPALAPAPAVANCGLANHAPAPAPAPAPTSDPLPPAPRPIQQGSVTSQAVPVSNNIVDACGFHFKAFKGCLTSHVDDISKCQIYVDMLKECRRNSGSVFGF